MKKSIVISLLTVITLLGTAICSLASTGKVTTDTLRLREQASTDSKTLELLSVGDEIEILEEQNGWYKVKYKEKVGYVAAQYINVLAEQNTNNINEDNNNQNNENTNSEPNNNENSENLNQEGNEENNNQTNENAEQVDILVVGTKLYITPLINSLVIKTLEEEKQVEIVSEISGWSYVKIGTTSGWVRTESLQKKAVESKTETPENNNNSSQKTGYISGSSVNFRKTPNTSGEIITKLTKNAKVTVITSSDGWTEIEYNGNRGYVSAEYISEQEIAVTSRGSAPRTESNKNSKTEKTTNAKAVVEEPAHTGTVTGADVIAYAKKYLGCKYRAGGSSPSGFDCSGFTTYVYKHFGISISRTSRGQASNGKTVSRDNLAAGDIICFSSSRASKSIGHVGIYVGGGKFIHSANSRQGVIISNVSGDGYYFVTASRVI